MKTAPENITQIGRLRDTRTRHWILRDLGDRLPPRPEKDMIVQAAHHGDGMSLARSATALIPRRDLTEVSEQVRYSAMAQACSDITYQSSWFMPDEPDSPWGTGRPTPKPAEPRELVLSLVEAYGRRDDPTDKEDQVANIDALCRQLRTSVGLEPTADRDTMLQHLVDESQRTDHDTHPEIDDLAAYETSPEAAEIDEITTRVQARLVWPAFRDYAHQLDVIERLDNERLVATIENQVQNQTDMFSRLYRPGAQQTHDTTIRTMIENHDYEALVYEGLADAYQDQAMSDEVRQRRDESAFDYFDRTREDPDKTDDLDLVRDDLVEIARGRGGSTLQARAAALAHACSAAAGIIMNDPDSIMLDTTSDGPSGNRVQAGASPRELAKIMVSAIDRWKDPRPMDEALALRVCQVIDQSENLAHRIEARAFSDLAAVPFHGQSLVTTRQMPSARTAQRSVIERQGVDAIIERQDVDHGLDEPEL